MHVTSYSSPRHPNFRNLCVGVNIQVGTKGYLPEEWQAVSICLLSLFGINCAGQSTHRRLFNPARKSVRFCTLRGRVGY
jgi:hypothetical protein